MKNWIQDHYWEARYRVDKVPLPQLRGIIQAAWNTAPDDFIQHLFDSWWNRCQAVINQYTARTLIVSAMKPLVPRNWWYY